jgi:AraC-like DNA-binding protein
MKPIYLQKNTQSGEQSFFVRYAEVPHTYNQFHFHKEYELLYNIENSGTRFVGDSVHRFESGDLVLVGPNIPHYWHSDDKYFREDSKEIAKVVLIQFIKNFTGDSFLELPEMQSVRDLLLRAEQGIQIKGVAAIEIGEKINALTQMQGRKRLLQMIEILCLMGEATEFNLLASKGFCEALKGEGNEKINQIFNFMINNYQSNINFQEIANFANMNPSAFCRYFKKHTSKTSSEVLNEIRIGFACKMLINSCESISEIGYSCGYMNIPYFNRQFKQFKGLTPFQYRELHQKKILIS